MKFKKKATPNKYYDFYKSCSELPLLVFIEIVVRKRYELIEKNSKCNNNELIQDAWAKLYGEYLDIIADEEQLNFLALYKQYELDSAKVMLLETLINFYPYLEDRTIRGIVISAGNKVLVFDRIKKRELFDKNILEIVKIHKSKYNELKRLLSKLKNKNESANKEITDVYFDEIALQAAEHLGYNSNLKDISTSQFAIYQRKLRERYEYLKNKELKDGNY